MNEGKSVIQPNRPILRDFLLLLFCENVLDWFGLHSFFHCIKALNSFVWHGWLPILSSETNCNYFSWLSCPDRRGHALTLHTSYSDAILCGKSPRFIAFSHKYNNSMEIHIHWFVFCHCTPKISPQIISFSGNNIFIFYILVH